MPGPHCQSPVHSWCMFFPWSWAWSYVPTCWQPLSLLPCPGSPLGVVLLQWELCAGPSHGTLLLCLAPRLE